MIFCTTQPYFVYFIKFVDKRKDISYRANMFSVSMSKMTLEFLKLLAQFFPDYRVLLNIFHRSIRIREKMFKASCSKYLWDKKVVNRLRKVFRHIFTRKT